MEDFFDPASVELCAICGGVWDVQDIRHRAEQEDEEALLILSQQGCPDCMRGGTALRERLITAGLIQRSQIGAFADESMERFFDPPYYEVMRHYFEEVGAPLPRLRTLDEMLAWARSHPTDEVAGDTSAAETGVPPRCHDALSGKAPDTWRFLAGFVDYGVDRRRIPYTQEILRVQQLLDRWREDHFPGSDELTYEQVIDLLLQVKRALRFHW